MRIFGRELTITRAKQAPTPTQPIWGDWGRAWWPVIREPFAGAWQQNMEIRPPTLLAFYAAYACVTLIMSDFSKCRLKLMEQDDDGIWTESEDSPAFSPVIRKPNWYQNRIQFYQNWIASKLINGNTYVFKHRDERRVVTAMTVLDPLRTKPLVTESGDVYYELAKDNLSGIESDRLVVPASEIIHDRMNPLYHPLCGISPLMAAAIPIMQGLEMQSSQTKFFQNGAQPSGVLTAPGPIPDALALRLKNEWEQNFTGNNAGRTAVLGDGLKYEQMSVNATDSELINQLKLSGEMVCSAFHVPAYMVGIGQMPQYNNIEALNQQYYSQCLQILFESAELCLDEGLGLDEKKDGRRLGTEFDIDDLLRMDTATRIKAAAEAVKGGIGTPNEERAKLDRKPIAGGDQAFLQQQNFSLAALAKRDAKDDPFKTGDPSQSQAQLPPAPTDDEPTAADAEKIMVAFQKGLAA